MPTTVATAIVRASVWRPVNDEWINAVTTITIAGTIATPTRCGSVVHFVPLTTYAFGRTALAASTSNVAMSSLALRPFTLFIVSLPPGLPEAPTGPTPDGTRPSRPVRAPGPPRGA